MSAASALTTTKDSATPWPTATQQLLEMRGYLSFEKIGYGSYSTVYKARKVNRDKPSEPDVNVALKYISLYTTSENYRKKFFPRELEATRTLRNPHLVHVHEVISEKGGMRYFILMELCASDLLHEVEVQSRIPETQGRIWCRQVVQGLAYIHRNQWVHRDMKIENILINFKYEALISDFTFIRQQRPPVLSNTFCGSLQYAAPEILSADKNYDGFRADIWSLGIIMFAIHCGCMPVFNEEDPVIIRKELTDIQHRIQTGVSGAGPPFSPALKDLLSKILQLDPKKRLPLDEALKHVWFTGSLSSGLSTHVTTLSAVDTNSGRTIVLPKVHASGTHLTARRTTSGASSRSASRKG